MEEARQLVYDHIIVRSNTPFRKTPQDKERINAHCKTDHLTHMTLSLKKNISNYNSSYSPPKIHPGYQSTTYDKELGMFRKYENSSSLHLPTITDNTQYQKLHTVKPQQKIVRSQEKQPWFIKHQWHQKMATVYQKDFSNKNATTCNSLNKLRVNYNNLQVFDLQATPKQTSQYRQEFKTYKVKPHLKLSIHNKDHLTGKENCNAKIESYTLHKKYDSGYFQTTCKTQQLELARRTNGLKIDRKRND